MEEDKEAEGRAWRGTKLAFLARSVGGISCRATNCDKRSESRCKNYLFAVVTEEACLVQTWKNLHSFGGSEERILRRAK